jgi:SAM-dependent methyltransferase
MHLLYRVYPAKKFITEYKYALKIISENNFKIVLDVGCGPGNLAKLLESDIEYVGIDVVIPKIIKPSFNTSFIVADGKFPPLRTEIFDAVFFINSIFYIADHKKEIPSIIRAYDSDYKIIIDIDTSFLHIKLADFIESLGRGKRITREKLVKIFKENNIEPFYYTNGATYTIIIRETQNSNSGMNEQKTHD